MIHTIKNIKWVIATFVICILLGVLTFFTFIDQSFIRLNSFNLQLLLFFDIALLVFFFLQVIFKTYVVLKEKKQGKIGAETSFRYITFFSITTLLPSIIIAIFSLILFNLSLQKYFNSKIKSGGLDLFSLTRNSLSLSLTNSPFLKVYEYSKSYRKS